jgi:hypothetical protein
MTQRYQMDWHGAVRQMHLGNVVQYVGTQNGPVWTDRGLCYCMQRGVIFQYKVGEIPYKSAGGMVYDPHFRYELTGETVDPRGWPNRPEKSLKTSLSYSRIGLNNV